MSVRPGVVHGPGDGIEMEAAHTRPIPTRQSRTADDLLELDPSVEGWAASKSNH